jgi:hypothetical protein
MNPPNEKQKQLDFLELSTQTTKPIQIFRGCEQTKKLIVLMCTNDGPFRPSGIRPVTVVFWTDWFEIIRLLRTFHTKLKIIESSGQK